MSHAIISVRNPASEPISPSPLTNHTSSPAKQSHDVQGRETVQFSLRDLETQEDNKFHDRHLHQPPPGLLLELQQLTTAEKAWLKKIATSTIRENGNYEPLSKFLTSLSERIYDGLPNDIRRNGMKIEFIPNGNTPMTCHPGKNSLPTQYAPNIIGIEGRRSQFSKQGAKYGYSAIPYHRAFTVADVKPDSKDGTLQAISYTWYQLQARPDLPGTYCLAANPKAYTVSWVDASGAVSSTSWLWHDQGEDEDSGAEDDQDGQDGQDGPDDSDGSDGSDDQDDAGVDIEAESEVDDDVDQVDGNGDEADEDADMDDDDAEWEEVEEEEGLDEDIVRGNVEHSDRDPPEDVREGFEDERNEPSNDAPQLDEDTDAGVQIGLDMLFRYLYSLYVPKSGHFLKDKTIAQCKQSKSQLCSPPTWNIQCGGTTYKNCKLLICYPPWGRRTTIFEHGKGRSRTIIKDYWFDVDRRFSELEVLDHIHSDGIMPGVVRAIESEYVMDGEGRGLTTAREPSRRRTGNHVKRRQRVRFVFKSVGEKLQEVRSLQELLYVFFDLNEVHRALLHRDVLHRDISANNILIQPTHRATGRQAVYNKKSPKFASDILKNPRKRNTKRTKDTSQCLLIDFDNSALLRPSSDNGVGVAGGLAQRTASVLCHKTYDKFLTEFFFIGYSNVYRAGDFYWSCIGKTRFAPMPVITGKARDLYDKAWGSNTYNRYCDHGDTCHGVTVPADKVLKNIYSAKALIPVVHKPHHDVESMFWSLYITAIQLVPKCDIADSITGVFKTTWDDIRKHRIADTWNEDVDIRDSLLTFLTDDMELALHPGLAASSPLTELIYSLGEQICPEYDLLDGIDKPEHLHEAMRRLLLDAIVKMEDQPDIEFDTTKIRTPYYLNEKRARTDDDDDDHALKRSRTVPIAGEGSRQFMTRSRHV
ncbi:hypothetical protein EIP86_008472 [Pleurotus ostreatoroseus]|nr:hypothetical protein EIP86_008472 [Pleurotus ostreatoroseus]